ncbi:MFS transporter [Amycolatopsis sp. cg5]|uniref:MFS transporter n=1 Tax=Amycolatopsis sp. cg5 TaxID=3238802 RepID=UPI003526827F
MSLLARYRSFDRPSRLLMLNQFAINVGFYMLMPYLATYLGGPLGLAGWAVGLVLGVRNFSQQGMFLVGGALADRFGYKPLIVAGCVLRTGGFAVLAVVDSLPSLLVASAATGFAGALFNPAVRAYLAADSGERRLEAFAVFNVFYQGGILAGPVVGLALTAVDFKLTCLVAAAVFGVLTVVQLKALPAQRERPEARSPAGIRAVAGNRSFLLFALVMIGSYVLTFQTYLALPLEARRIAGPGAAGTAVIAALFVVSGGLAIAGQLKITAWFQRKWPPGTCMAAGICLMALAFVAPGAAARTGPVLAGVALVLSAALLALGTVAVFPFEMDTVVRFAGGRLVATYYGFYNTVVGVGILLGNLFTGTVFDLARSSGWPELPWLGLVALGGACAFGLRALERSGHLDPVPAPA